MDTKEYKHKWRYEDKDRPLRDGHLYAVCYDCGLAYGSFPDMVIPDELWEEINPTRWEGAGILCPTCIANRLDYIGKWYAGDLFLLKVKEEKKSKGKSKKPWTQAMKRAAMNFVGCMNTPDVSPREILMEMRGRDGSDD